jgi:hypothetical protein
MTSLDSLLYFLRDVWLLGHMIRQLGEQAGVDMVYKLYSDSAHWQLGPTWSPEQNQAYLDLLNNLREALGVPRLTGNQEAMKQQFKALEEAAARRGEQRVKYSIQQGDEATGFLHFYNVSLAPAGGSRVANERIYLSLKAKTAPEVMRFVTRELVYNPQMTGITAAKIAGPQRVGQRGDSIVIYGEDAPSIQRALDKIVAYQNLHPHHFVDSPMPMAQPISKGVSIGSEPAASFGGVSFGKLRAKAIYEALKQATSLHDFLKRVRESFRTHRIDPERPHLNLP